MKDNDVKRIIDDLTKHYSNTNNPIDFPTKKEIPMLERFAAQSLVEHDGELIFSKEKFAELIVRECIRVIDNSTPVYSSEDLEEDYCQGNLNGHQSALLEIKQHFGVEE